MVLGKLPPRKIGPSPNSNANRKPNPDPDRGSIFLGGNFPDTINNKCINTEYTFGITYFYISKSITSYTLLLALKIVKSLQCIIKGSILIKTVLINLVVFNKHDIFRPGIIVDWLSTDCLLIAYWLSTDCLLIVYWLSIDCLLIVYWLSTDCLLIVYWLPTDCLLIVYWLSTDCILIVYWNT